MTKYVAERQDCYIWHKIGKILRIDKNAVITGCINGWQITPIPEQVLEDTVLLCNFPWKN